MKLTTEQAIRLLKKSLPYPEKIEVKLITDDESCIYFVWRGIRYRWLISSNEIMLSTSNSKMLEQDATCLIIQHSINAHYSLGNNSIISELYPKQDILLTKIAIFFNELLAERIITPNQKRDIEEYMINNLKPKE